MNEPAEKLIVETRARRDEVLAQRSPRAYAALRTARAAQRQSASVDLEKTAGACLLLLDALGEGPIPLDIVRLQTPATRPPLFYFPDFFAWCQR